MKDLILLFRICWKETLFIVSLFVGAIAICFIVELCAGRCSKPQPVQTNIARTILELRQQKARDSSNYVAQTAYLFQDNEDLRNLLAENDQEIARLKSQHRQIEGAQIVSTSQKRSIEVTYDTIIVSDTVRIPVRKPIAYSDEWISISEKDSLRIAIRDSLSSYVVRLYKHKFLWWRWGTKGYEVRIINHNPYSTIKSNLTVIRK